MLVPEPVRNALGASTRALLLLLLFVLVALPATPCRADVSVFVYHRFGDSRYPSTNISLEIFAAQLRHLRDAGYEVLPLGEIVHRLRKGEALPDRCTALTVDDAYASFWEGARPLLREFGFPVTLFVHTGAVGGRDQLTWDQLRILASEGVEIGNHTVSHAYLVERLAGETAREWRVRVEKEIRAAQEKLTEELGEAPGLFAYPFGEYSSELMEIVQLLGFDGAAGQQSGVVAGREQLYLLPRFPMGGAYGTLDGFVEKLKMRHLPVQVLAPAGPLIDPEKPPVLEFRLETEAVDLRRLRCFVSGKESGRVSGDPERQGVFRAWSEEPLQGRRSRYTLTAPGRDGRSWYWFSQLWIDPDADDG